MSGKSTTVPNMRVLRLSISKENVVNCSLSAIKVMVSAALNDDTKIECIEVNDKEDPRHGPAIYIRFTEAAYCRAAKCAIELNGLAAIDSVFKSVPTILQLPEIPNWKPAAQATDQIVALHKLRYTCSSEALFRIVKEQLPTQTQVEILSRSRKLGNALVRLHPAVGSEALEHLRRTLASNAIETAIVGGCRKVALFGVTKKRNQEADGGERCLKAIVKLMECDAFFSQYLPIFSAYVDSEWPCVTVSFGSFMPLSPLLERIRNLLTVHFRTEDGTESSISCVATPYYDEIEFVIPNRHYADGTRFAPIEAELPLECKTVERLLGQALTNLRFCISFTKLVNETRKFCGILGVNVYYSTHQDYPLQLTFLVDVGKLGETIPTDVRVSTSTTSQSRRAFDALHVSLEDKVHLMTVHFCKALIDHYYALQRESVSDTIVRPVLTIGANSNSTSNWHAATAQEPQLEQDLRDFTPHEIQWLLEVGELDRVCSQYRTKLINDVNGRVALHCTLETAQRIKESLCYALRKYNFGEVKLDWNDAAFNGKLQNDACRSLLQDKLLSSSFVEMTWFDSHDYKHVVYSVLIRAAREQLGHESTQLVLWNIHELEKKVSLFGRVDQSIAVRFAKTIIDRISCALLEINATDRKLLTTKRWTRICRKLAQDAFVSLRPTGQQIAVAVSASADSNNSFDKTERAIYHIKHFFEVYSISNDFLNLEPVVYTIMSTVRRFRDQCEQLNSSTQKEAEKAGLDGIVIQDVKEERVTNGCIELHCGFALSGSKLLVDSLKQKLSDIVEAARKCDQRSLQFMDENGHQLDSLIAMRLLRSNQTARQIVEAESANSQFAVIYSLVDTKSGKVCAVDQLQFGQSATYKQRSSGLSRLVQKAAYTTFFACHVFEVHVGMDQRDLPCDLHIDVVCGAPDAPDVSYSIDHDRLCVIAKSVLSVEQHALDFNLRRAVSALMQHCTDSDNGDYCVNVTFNGDSQTLQGVKALVVERVLEAHDAQVVRGTIRFLAKDDAAAADIVFTLQNVNTCLLRWSPRNNLPELNATKTNTNALRFAAVTKHGLHVNFTVGDVVNEQADAIVFGLLLHDSTSATSNFTGALYSAILRALEHDASRFQLELKLTEAHSQKISIQKHSTVTFCSSGGSLQCDVLVAVRFAHQIYHGDKSKKVLIEIVSKLLLEVFHTAKLRRVAFTMLGTGIHGWKAPDAAEAFADALLAFSASYPSLARNAHVTIVGFNGTADYQQYEKTIYHKLEAGGATLTKNTATLSTPKLNAAGQERRKLQAKKNQSSPPRRRQAKLLLIGSDADASNRIESALQELVSSTLFRESINLEVDFVPLSRRVLNELEWINEASIEVQSSSEKQNQASNATSCNTTVLHIAGTKDSVLNCFFNLNKHILPHCMELSKALATFQRVQWRVLSRALYGCESFDVYQNHEIEMQRRNRSIKGETPKPIDVQRFCTLQKQRRAVKVDVCELVEVCQDLNMTSRALSRCAVMLADGQLDADGLPLEWDPMRAEETLRVVKLDPHSDEFRSVCKRIKSELKQKVLAVERIQNRKLYKQFRAECEEFSERFKSTAESLPKLLYHGTKEDHKDSIAMDGLDRSRAGLNVGAIYGKGVYFSNDFKVSAQTCYAVPNAAGEQHMFLCDVLVGSCVLGNTLMQVLPNSYDTAVDSLNNPKIYVKFRDAPIYPKYFVKFTIPNSVVKQ